MSISEIYHRRNEYTQIIIRKFNEWKCKQYIQGTHRRVLLLSYLAISLLLILFFYSFDSPAKEKRSIHFYRQRIFKGKFFENDEEPIIFSKSIYFNQTVKPSENVICFLVASFTGDTRVVYNPYPNLRDKVHQLDERLGDNYSTDVIIFHTGYPFRGDLALIFENTRRQVEFVNIDHIFYRFSPSFDPHLRDPTWTQRGKWNYHHMCYFWFKQVFQLKILQRYRYMMRMDDDSQILGKWPNVFDLMVKHQAVYLANKREADNEYILPGLTLVRNLTRDYIVRNQILVRNPAMLALAFNHSVEIPHYWNNFEVVDLAFIQRDDVLDFIQMIDQSQGVFLYRWGDAPLRYITLALFANETEILYRERLGLIYCHPC